MRIFLVLAIGCASSRPVADSRDDALRLHAEARAAYVGREWSKCAELYARSDDSYNSACCFARAGLVAEAFAQLRSEAKSGQLNAADLESDADFAALRETPQWPALLLFVAEQKERYRASLNSELYELFLEDQADRRRVEIDWSVVTPRDERRKKRADQILKVSGAKVSADFFHAAMIFQHSFVAADARRAVELALKAVELNASNAQAKWLFAAATDSELMILGKPQKFGTQSQKLPEGRWQLWPVDETVTDEERAKWNVPSLDASRRQIEQMNGPLP